MGSGLITASGHDGNRTYWLKMGLMAGKPGANPEMKPDPIYATVTSPWPHRLAVLLVGMTFPLIWVGGLVTTYDAGMSVPDWPNTYGYNLLLYPWSSWISGPWDLFIEHGHRLLAVCVGLLTIGLLIVTWLQEPRRWVKWLSVGCLTMVLLQGALGGARVLLDEILLAQIHGVIGPLFFLVCVALAAVTSGWWQADASDVGESAAALRRPAWIMLVLASRAVAAGIASASPARRLAGRRVPLPGPGPPDRRRVAVAAVGRRVSPRWTRSTRQQAAPRGIVGPSRRGARAACRGADTAGSRQLARQVLVAHVAAALDSESCVYRACREHAAGRDRHRACRRGIIDPGHRIPAVAARARRAEPTSTASKSLASLRNMESPA